jgi:hypothetical protein
MGRKVVAAGSDSYLIAGVCGGKNVKTSNSDTNILKYNNYAGVGNAVVLGGPEYIVE